jgi:hypothetical protein
MSPSRVAGRCGGRATATAAPHSFLLTTKFPGLTGYADGSDGLDRPAEDLRFHIDLAERLQLTALASELGPFDVVFESKTSAVVFTLRGDDAITRVHASLFSPKAYGESPVQGITIRRRRAE